MKRFYETGGILNKGFVGQISYTVCLDRVYDTMDIEFTFDKQHYTDITEEMKEEVRSICKEEYDIKEASDEELVNAMKEMKTEIHTIATMNDVFIGGVHKQLTTRHMLYSPEQTSDGCIPQETIHGVIKVTLVVFNVLLDDTAYRLTLSLGDPVNCPRQPKEDQKEGSQKGGCHV